MLSSLTRPNYPRAAFGFGHSTVTALSLQRESGGGFGIRQAATLETPHGLIIPSFTDENISDQGALISLIEKVATECGLRGQRSWSVSLPSNAARTAILSVKEVPASRKELQEVLEFKAETSFGVPSSELRISKQKISPDHEGRLRFFASAVKLSVIDEYETVFEALGWRAGLILPRAVCEMKWLAESKSQGDSLLISSQENGFTALLLRSRRTRPRQIRELL